MIKNDIIRISREIRRLKDEAKKDIKNINSLSLNFDEYHGTSCAKIILPGYLFKNSLDIRASMNYFNGFIIEIPEGLIVVDPGVDFYNRMTCAGYSPTQIRAMIITHEHIDHLGDLNIFLEKFSQYSSSKIEIFISNSAYSNFLSNYRKSQLDSSDHIHLTLLSSKEEKIIHTTILGKYQIQFLELFHSCKDTFGFKVQLGNVELWHISDTGYAIEVQTNKGIYDPSLSEGDFMRITQKHEYIKDFYQSNTYSIVNINDIDYNRHSRTHLSGYDVIDIFSKSSLEKLILQHLIPINIESEDSNYLYKLFFDDQKFKTVIPHYLKKEILLNCKISTSYE